jgi:hypothetical protein
MRKKQFFRRGIVVILCAIWFFFGTKNEVLGVLFTYQDSEGIVHMTNFKYLNDSEFVYLIQLIPLEEQRTAIREIIRDATQKNDVEDLKRMRTISAELNISVEEEIGRSIQIVKEKHTEQDVEVLNIGQPTRENVANLRVPNSLAEKEAMMGLNQQPVSNPPPEVMNIVNESINKIMGRSTPSRRQALASIVDSLLSVYGGGTDNNLKNENIYDRGNSHHHINAGEDATIKNPPPAIINNPQVGINRGAIDVTTGQFCPGVAGGIINPRNGQFYPDVGSGYIKPQTGQFMPKLN